jgi:hypothetical protein
MKAWKAFMLALLLVFVMILAGAGLLIHHGFRATNRPSTLETTVARVVRNYSISSADRNETNPLDGTPQNLQDGRNVFLPNARPAMVMTEARTRRSSRYILASPILASWKRRTSPMAKFTTLLKMVVR